MAQSLCLLIFSNLYFEQMPLKSWKMCRWWYIKAVAKQHWSSYEWWNISRTMCTFLNTRKNIRKNEYLRQTGPKLYSRLDTPRIAHWNQILKTYANDLMNKQNCLQWASWKNRFICRKRSKCLLFTILWTRPFEERGRLKVVCFTDMASTILSEQCYKYRK